MEVKKIKCTFCHDEFSIIYPTEKGRDICDDCCARFRREGQGWDKDFWGKTR